MTHEIKVTKEIRHDYKETYESVRYFMMKRKIPRPQSFKQFWCWYKVKYSNQLESDGFKGIKQVDIVDFGVDFKRKKTER